MDTSRSVLIPIKTTWTDQKQIRLFIKRDDLIHELVSGNKWRKLKYFLKTLKERKNEGILTFGGAYSNHLLATAAYGDAEGIPTVGVVRGDELTEESNETLRDCSKLGMKLKFVSRAEYELKDERNYKEYLLEEFPNFLIIPEGGAGYLGMLGCQEIITEIDRSMSYDALYVAQGTTTTSCGMALGIQQEQELHVVPVLKGFDSIGTMKEMLSRAAFDEEFIEEILKHVHVHDAFHFGGYGKVEEELLVFIRSFYQETGIRLDPVYTGKAMFALYQNAVDGMHDGQTVVFVHTGGLQGARSYESKFGPLFFNT